MRDIQKGITTRQKVLLLTGGGRGRGGNGDAGFFQTNYNHNHNARRGSGWESPSLSPTRDSTAQSIPSIALIIFLSFTLAEILERFFGLFQDDHGIRSKQNTDRWKEDFLSNLDRPEEVDWIDRFDELVDNLGDWWRRNTQEKNGILRLDTWKKKAHLLVDVHSIFGTIGTLERLSFKHQFAIGCSVGMIFQPVAWGLGNAAFFVYVASEMMYNLKCAGEEININGAIDESDDGGTSRREYFSVRDDSNRPRPRPRASKYHPDKFDQDSNNNSLLSGAIHACSDCLENVRHTARNSFDAIADTFGEHQEEMNALEDGIGTAIVGVAFGVLVKSLW